MARGAGHGPQRSSHRSCPELAFRIAAGSRSRSDCPPLAAAGRHVSHRCGQAAGGLIAPDSHAEWLGCCKTVLPLNTHTVTSKKAKSNAVTIPFLSSVYGKFSIFR